MICEYDSMNEGGMSTVYDDYRNAAFIPDEEREIAAYLFGPHWAATPDEAETEHIPCKARVMNPDEWNLMQTRMTEEEKERAEYEALFDRV